MFYDEIYRFIMSLFVEFNFEIIENVYERQNNDTNDNASVVVCYWVLLCVDEENGL